MRIGNRTRHILGASAVATLLGGLLSTGVATAAPGPTAVTPASAPVSGTTAGAASSADAVAFQENATHDGLAGGAALPATLRPAWRRNLGGSASYPVIAGGRMFVTVENPSFKAAAYGLDAATGRTLWGPLPLTGTYGFAAMTYANGRLFVVDNGGLLQALDPATGARLWSRTLAGQYQFSSPPVAAAGLVLTGGAGSGGTLYAVDQRTGALVWTQSVANGDDSSPAVAAGHVYVSYACAFAYAFTLSGAPVWSRNDGCEGGGGATPVVHGSTLWVRDGFQTPEVLSTVDGSVLRTFSSGTPPAFAGTRAVLLQDGTLTAVSAATGRVLWSQAGDGGLDTAPVISGSTVYVGSSTGTVTGFDLATGRAVWSGRTGSSISGWNESNREVPQDLGIGDGYLVVPTASTLVAYH